MNLTLQEVRDRINYLMEHTTVMPTARTNVADIDLVNGVGREAHFVTADSDGHMVGDLIRQIQDLDVSLERAREQIAEYEGRVEGLRELLR